MNRTLQKLFFHLRHPERVLRYAKWVAAKTRPFLPSLCLLLDVEAAVVLVGFASSFISKHVVDSATSGRDFLTAFIIMKAL